MAIRGMAVLLAGTALILTSSRVEAQAGARVEATLNEVGWGEAVLHFEGPASEVSMPRRQGRSIVMGRLGDEGPYHWLIDTGASISVIDAQIASDLGLETVGSIPVGAPGGAQVNADLVRLPSVFLGDLEIEGAAAVVLDLVEMTGGAMQGILGMDLFSDVLLTLDPTGERAVVSRGDLRLSEPGVLRAERIGGRLVFQIDVAGRSVPAQIDTGSPGGITLGVDLIESVPTLDEPERQASAGLVGGNRLIRLRTLDGSVRFAGLEFENPPVGFMDPAPGTANIGSGILNDLETTIDQRNGLIAFRRPAAVVATGPVRRTRVAPTGTRRRLGVRFRGASAGFTHVASVDAGSLGERAGFKAGDELVRLNGRPMAEYDQAALGALLGGSEPLRWELRRDNEMLVIDIR